LVQKIGCSIGKCSSRVFTGTVDKEVACIGGSLSVLRWFVCFDNAREAHSPSLQLFTKTGTKRKVARFFPKILNHFYVRQVLPGSRIENSLLDHKYPQLRLNLHSFNKKSRKHHLGSQNWKLSTLASQLNFIGILNRLFGILMSHTHIKR